MKEAGLRSQLKKRKCSCPCEGRTNIREAHADLQTGMNEDRLFATTTLLLHVNALARSAELGTGNTYFTLKA